MSVATQIPPEPEPKPAPDALAASLPPQWRILVQLLGSTSMAYVVALSALFYGVSDVKDYFGVLVNIPATQEQLGESVTEVKLAIGGEYDPVTHAMVKPGLSQQFEGLSDQFEGLSEQLGTATQTQADLATEIARLNERMEKFGKDLEEAKGMGPKEPATL